MAGQWGNATAVLDVPPTLAEPWPLVFSIIDLGLIYCKKYYRTKRLGGKGLSVIELRHFMEWNLDISKSRMEWRH